MIRKQKLELTWVGKDVRPRPEPRILLEETGLSHHATARMGEGDLFENHLIQGDNLLALKALEAEFTGRVKCVYIDPPYNTGSDFHIYPDGLEHSSWLNMMRARVELFRNLLASDGSLWVHLDDNEVHYLKVALDEVFGRSNFVASVVWNKSYAVRSNAEFFSTSHEYILVYCKEREHFKPNQFPRTKEQEDRYDNLDDDHRGPWQSVTMTISLVGGARGRQYAKTGKSDNVYEVRSPSGKQFKPPPNRCWSRNPQAFAALDADHRIWWGRNGDGAPRLKQFLSKANGGVIPTTLWADGERYGHNEQGIRELRALGVLDFPTPKPERLIAQVLTVATNPGDLVLDSFAGSGTTGAVAHKMGRRWIMVELGEHARTHIVPRMTKVVDGADPGGVTEVMGWVGGGGFRFFRLAPSLLETDKWGREVVSKAYNPVMLAEALCKLEGFIYAPSETEYWNHGRSTERDFIYITTQTLTHEQLRDLSEQVGGNRTLLVLCTAYRGDARSLPNLTIKKIPDYIRDRCEWSHDDYSLQVEALPPAPEAPARTASRQSTLFAKSTE